MKRIFFLSLAALSGSAALAQNSVVVNQQGGPQHEVSIVQKGSGNTSVVNQSGDRNANQVSVVQSGSGNVATINQGNGGTGASDAQNSVNTTQSGEGETIVNQTNGGNSISVYQSGEKAANKKEKTNEKKPKK